ncbi:MAG: hypothetical protein ABSD21_03030 [Rhizomicrobium sp.]
MTEVEALLISAAIEAPIAYLIVRAMHWPSRGAVQAGFAAAVATAVTHPQLWSAALWAYPRFGYWPSVIFLEMIVVLVEGGLIGWMASLSLHRAMLVSLATNTASCAAGFLIHG